ncbi:DUF1488 family protein [Pseudaquabacterium pictum]|uniref:DUF1488 domain-containing protein n=1 Tax=Pseudaquabacterium pictum TaxID=2315236 RepID=A0A480AM60_9BURK|nr:DUF1488 family protein [Rubrivivax pictus]GCL61477.1 hypothetical protein AQPW35_05580 [Rubrivivax pictus]
MPQPAFWHDDSGSVRFWVMVDGNAVGASVSRQTLHHRFMPGRTDDDQPLATYTAHADLLHDAVRRRVATGSIEPVMLREHDLPQPPR